MTVTIGVVLSAFPTDVSNFSDGYSMGAKNRPLQKLSINPDSARI
jgi:hypothetical protein